MRRALLCLLAPLLLVGPALLPGRRLLPQLPIGFEPLAGEHPAAAAESWEHANRVTSDRLFPILTDELAVGAELARGRLPLWDPHLGLGMPLAAGTVAGPWYPPNWLRYALPPALAGGWLALLSLWLAGLGMALFLERAGLSMRAALVGALAYQLSGFAAVNLHYAMKVDAALWLPWALWALEGLFAGARRAGLWLALSVGLSLLAGFAQIGAFTAAAVLFVALWRSLELDRGLGGFALAAPFVALGCGLAAVQLVPMAELSAHALRQPQGAAELWPQRTPLASLWSIPFPRWFFGAAADMERATGLTAAGALYPPGYVNPLEWTVGGGLIATLLALSGAALAPRRSALPVALLALALGFAQGWPLARYLYYLPGAGLGAPGRAAAVAWPALAWLAALGAAGLLGKLRSGGAALAVCCALAFGLLAEGHFNGALHLVPRRVAAADSERAALFPASEGMQAVRRAAGDGRVLRLDLSPSGVDDVLALARPNLPHAYGIKDLTPYVVFTNRRLVELFEALDPRTRYRTGVSRLVEPAQLANPLLDLARVTCVLSREPLAHPRLAPVLERPGFHVYRRSGALPLAFGVTAIERVHDGAAARRLVEGELDLATTALIAQHPSSGPALPPGLGEGRVRVLATERPAPGRLDAKVEADAPGLVVFTEAWMPGWRASVNGEDAPVLRANHVLRAVPVPAGRSLVRTRYEPGSLRIGLALTLLSLGLAFLFGRGARRRRA